MAKKATTKPKPKVKAKAKKAAPRSSTRKRKRASYDDLPWTAIRRDYEGSTAALRQLATAYGMASENTIRQRIAKEGWVRDIDAIAKGITMRSLAMDPDDDRRPAAKPPAPVSAAPARKPAPKHLPPPPPEPEEDEDEDEDEIAGDLIGEVFGAAAALPPDPEPDPAIDPPPEDIPECAQEPVDIAPKTPAKRGRKGGAHKARTPPDPATQADAGNAQTDTCADQQDGRTTTSSDQDARGEADVDIAVNLASIQTKHIRRELAMGRRMMDLAETVIEHMEAVLLGDPQDVANSRIRLSMISPDKETLTNLMKSAALLGESGACVVRRAVGLPVSDRKNSQTGLPGAPLPASTHATDRLLSVLGTDTLKQLRAAALDLTRRPVAQEEPRP